MLDANQIVGSHDILFVTLDTLRFDVAQRAFEQAAIPNLARYLPADGWEARHTPGNFTYAAHHAFFAGFFPTPVAPGRHERLFAVEFPGSETCGDQTCVLDSADIVTGVAQHGYHTVCIGGVGFFNKCSPLGNVLPNLFHESHWDQSLGVTDPDSTKNQVDLAMQIVRSIDPLQRIFLFLNVSALHQPNCHYLPGAEIDSAETQAAALVYVDQHLPRLIEFVRQRGPLFCILTSDHGTAYGEDGYVGHRINHPVVWTVPYAEFELKH